MSCHSHSKSRGAGNLDFYLLFPTQRGGRVRGSVMSHATIRRPPAPVGPSHHVRTQWCGPACIHCYMCHYNNTIIHQTKCPHPPSSPCHIVTRTTLVTQVHVVAVDPTPGPIASEALCIMYGPPADTSEPNKVGVYVVYSVCLVTCDLQGIFSLEAIGTMGPCPLRLSGHWDLVP